MADRISHLLGRMRDHPAGIRFEDLRMICDRYFGPPRQSGGSHLIYKMPGPGFPRINIQDDRGRAKAYQVKQVLSAIEKLETGDDPEG